MALISPCKTRLLFLEMSGEPLSRRPWRIEGAELRLKKK